MDPLTLILTALGAGAAFLAQQAASEAVKDAYRALKTRLQQKFADKPEATMALAKYADKPDVWRAPLHEALAETAADQDRELITAAQQLLALVDPRQTAMGKYNVQIAGPVQGFVQGDHAQVTMTFGDTPQEP
jgi:hypothetical protein